MNYYDYEDYMRSILGYQNGNIYANTYNPNNEYYYNTMNTMNDMQSDYLEKNRESDPERINKLYPEVYKLLYPMVCKACNLNSNREITNDLVDSMTEEIYLNFESDDKLKVNMTRNLPPLKNGDVRNPNAKEPETRGENRQNNSLLKDLIKILVLREFAKPIRPEFPLGKPPIAPPPPPNNIPPRPQMGPGQWRPY